jgi:hypothetical protein
MSEQLNRPTLSRGPVWHHVSAGLVADLLLDQVAHVHWRFQAVQPVATA